MSRSEFLKTLAVILAGAHTAGPVSLAGAPMPERRRRARNATAARDARPAARNAVPCP